MLRAPRVGVYGPRVDEVPVAQKQGSPFLFKLKVLAALIVVVLIAWTAAAVLRGAPDPTIDVTTALPAIGPKNSVHVVVTEPERGLSDVKVELVQGELVKALGEATYAARSPWKWWGELVPTHEVQADIGKTAIPELKAGEATIRVTAGKAPGVFGRPDPVVVEKKLEVKLLPPMLTPTSQFVYVAQGGSEVVTYEVGESSVRDGVEAGAWFFPGYPLPNGPKSARFALFAVPYDMDDPSSIALVAEDALGNKAKTTFDAFTHKFTPRPLGQDVIALNEKFMQKVTGEIIPRTPSLSDKGDLLQNFLQLNNDLRKANAQQLRELAAKTKPAFLWKGAFVPMKDAAVMGSFAQRRSYQVDGKQVDTQDHLGFDLASLQRAPVLAANSGEVVLADYFGIYGNCVVVDHGYGLMSLYAHLSSIAVKPGDKVEKQQELGRTGATGLAGGDHLHFTMLLHGLAITPVEWWDAHWIADRVKLKLGDALPL
jgi:murein DD-endopeptidase MepM/ murein hydrolase activator NlpD